MTEIKTNGKRNREAGHSWERECAKKLCKIGFPHVATSRSISRDRDNTKVDLMNKMEEDNGRLPFNVQCKTTNSQLSYAKLLDEMPNSTLPNVIFHRHTARTNNRFVTKGLYAITTLDHYLDLLHRINNYEKAYKLVDAYLEHLDEEVRVKFEEELGKL